jgi:3-phenylpropionate/trans-cinnamate dioxygenase ferredoxin reductase component
LPGLSRTVATMRRVSENVLIVGGGLAAQRAAETLRARGHHGPVRVVCGEPVAPYDRPPLSKELLRTGVGEPRFRPAAWYEQQGVELLLGRRAAALDVARRRVRLEDGAELAYGDLIVATGSHPRRLPGLVGRPNVHVLRTLADARALHAALVPGVRLAIVGAGFIGQEVAATARALGAEVCLIEAASAPLLGVLGPRLGGWFADLHRSEGVRVELDVAVAEARPAVAGAAVRELALADGRTIAADVVLVAVGVAPEMRWLAGSPLAGDGIAVDAGARTAVPHVYAAGDVARPADPDTGARLRCEHWEPAARLGTTAARSILGLDPAPAPPASFWSDQYGTRIQLVGEAAGADAVELDGRPDARDFTAVLTRRGVLCGALLVGRPRELSQWRRRLADARPARTERSAA